MGVSICGRSSALTKLDDLHDTDIPELLAEVELVEEHFHPPLGNLNYGMTAGVITNQSTVPIQVIGGNDAFGAGVVLSKGTLPGVTFDPCAVMIVAVSKIDCPTIIELWSGTLGIQVAYTSAADDVVTAAGHSCIDGDRVIFDTMDDESKGINKQTVYFVRDMSGNTFKVATTATGGAVDITGTPAGFIKKISSPSRKSEFIASAASLTKNADQKTFKAPRILSSEMFWCRAKSKSGETITVSFFMDIHSYPDGL